MCLSCDYHVTVLCYQTHLHRLPFRSPSVSRRAVPTLWWSWSIAHATRLVTSCNDNTTVSNVMLFLVYVFESKCNWTEATCYRRSRVSPLPNSCPHQQSLTWPCRPSSGGRGSVWIMCSEWPTHTTLISTHVHRNSRLCPHSLCWSLCILYMMVWQPESSLPGGVQWAQGSVKCIQA